MVLRMMLHLTACLWVLTLSIVHAQTLEERMDEVNERLKSKHGIEVGGKLQSEYYHSDLSGPAKADTNYAFETTQYTSFDLTLQYRPYDFIWARTDIRFYQDWQTFFATRSRILASRWLSVDGNISNMLAFNAGDFSQKYSPLTLWSPELELIEEPLIFSRGRKELMEEQYLADNNRVLQGLNLNFAKRLDIPLNEIHADAIAARLRRGEFLDKTGAHGFGTAKSDMDRFLFAGNAEAFIQSNFFLGGSLLSMLDDRESYRMHVHTPEFIQAMTDLGTPAPAGWSLNDQDSVIARDLSLFSVRSGLDLAGFLDNSSLTLELLGEFASSNEANRFAWHFQTDSTGGPHTVVLEGAAPGTQGKALNLELMAGYQALDSAMGIELVAEYLQNEATFLNPMAQSPTFTANRIMNSENDFENGRLYSTFDALNNGVYKFSPSQKTPSHHQAPYTKTAYHNAVMSPEDLSTFNSDPIVQLTLPFGSATPNRKGVKAKLTSHWHHYLHLTLVATALQQISGDRVENIQAKSRTFTEMGGGAKVALHQLLHLENQVNLSASYIASSSERPSVVKELNPADIHSSLLLAGFDWHFFTKWGLLGGFEQGTSTTTVRTNELGTEATPLVHSYQYAMSETQNHFRLGLEYSLAKDAYFMVSGGMLSVDRTLSNKGTTENTEGPLVARNVQSEFSQLLSQALIKVKF